jgi:hypothetical protein
MQRHRILFTAIICVPSAITCFPLLAANKRLQQSSVDCSVGRITHFERPLVRRLSFAANAQHEDSDIPETSSREEKATITTGTAETQPTLQKISTARAGGRVASSSRRRLANARSPAGDSGSIELNFNLLLVDLLISGFLLGSLCSFLILSIFDYLKIRNQRLLYIRPTTATVCYRRTVNRE